METRIKKIDCNNMNSEDFSEAVRLLREGRLVAFPTETVYGLGGDAFDATASARIYAAKGRPSDNPLIVHIAELESLKQIACDIPESAYLLAEHFWPGPLTMILRRGERIPRETTGGLDTVAVRMPSHPIARRLIQESGLFIAAPSANASGRPSTTRAEHVIEDLSGRIDMIIDGGSSDIGLESTIVDLTTVPPAILRPGYITTESLRALLPDIELDKAVTRRAKDDNIVARAPGMKYRHYAPQGELVIYEGAQEAVVREINNAAADRLKQGFRVGILASEESAGEYLSDCRGEGVTVVSVGSRNDEVKIAAGLFDALRSFDTLKADYIYAESFDSSDLGQAIMNRLLKAAGYSIIKC